MLLLQDSSDRTKHKFLLNSISLDELQVFSLVSPTYSGLEIQFTLETPKHKLPTGYTVSVHLFKNPFHVQSQIIDVRTQDRAQANGKIGYMFNLEALFTPQALQLDSHRYCFAYFGLEYLFQKMDTFQTKDAVIKADPYLISDFFDDDTIILVLCNELCDDINDFNIMNYLPNLFLNGFKLLTKTNLIEIENDHLYLEDNYKAFTTLNPHNSTSIYPLRLEKAKIAISSEAYVVHLFTNLIQKKFDRVTRFLMLYQVVEIFMPKMIHLEVRQRLCQDLDSLNIDKVKELVIGLTKQIELITALLSRHAIPTNKLEMLLRTEILDFFVHVNHPDYADPTKNASFSLSDLFYSFRNKLVHEYRILHQVGVDTSVTDLKINTINQLTEALIAETITVYSG